MCYLSDKLCAKAEFSIFSNFFIFTPIFFHYPLIINNGKDPRISAYLRQEVYQSVLLHTASKLRRVYSYFDVIWNHSIYVKQKVMF